MGREWPKLLYRGPGPDGEFNPPVWAHTREDRNKLGPGFYESYVFQPFPARLYATDGSIKEVHTYTEEKAALASGWQKAYVAPQGSAPVMNVTPVATAGPAPALDAEQFNKINETEFGLQVANGKIANLEDAVFAMKDILGMQTETIAALRAEVSASKSALDSLVAVISKATGVKPEAVLKESQKVTKG